MREALAKAKKMSKKADIKFSKAIIFYRKNYQPFQVEVLNILAKQEYVNGDIVGDWRGELKI